MGAGGAATGGDAVVVARVVFAASIQRHVETPERAVAADSVGKALAEIFKTNPRLQTYVLDDQGHLRKHVTIFIDGRRIADPIGLSDRLEPASEVFVFQALSGG